MKIEEEIWKADES